jgi:antitoxin (DNA-binding transcriptional repressor) of toxin-antitoxin stability system
VYISAYSEGMRTTLISTKEIRNDLVGFLRALKNGQTFQVMHRSKPLVRISAEEDKVFTAPDAGTHAAILRSISLADSLRDRTPTLDPHKSIKDLYEETQDYV